MVNSLTARSEEMFNKVNNALKPLTFEKTGARFKDTDYIQIMLENEDCIPTHTPMYTALQEIKQRKNMGIPLKV